LLFVFVVFVFGNATAFPAATLSEDSRPAKARFAALGKDRLSAHDAKALLSRQTVAIAIVAHSNIRLKRSAVGMRPGSRLPYIPRHGYKLISALQQNRQVETAGVLPVVPPVRHRPDGCAEAPGGLQ
jgi:hypothetical protein